MQLVAETRPVALLRGIADATDHKRAERKWWSEKGWVLRGGLESEGGSESVSQSIINQWDRYVLVPLGRVALPLNLVNLHEQSESQSASRTLLREAERV